MLAVLSTLQSANSGSTNGRDDVEHDPLHTGYAAKSATVVDIQTHDNESFENAVDMAYPSEHIGASCKIVKSVLKGALGPARPALQDTHCWR